MRMGSKGHIAVIAMIDVAMREESGPVSLTDVALRQQVSLSYLEQLFSKLRQRGLVNSVRGPGGGYCIGSSLVKITVKDIICAVEDAAPRPMRSDPTTVHRMTQALWDAMHARGLEFMHAVTLQGLVDEQVAMGVKLGPRPAHNRGVLKRPLPLHVHPNTPNSVFALGRMLPIRG